VNLFYVIILLLQWQTVLFINLTTNSFQIVLEDVLFICGLRFLIYSELSNSFSSRPRKTFLTLVRQFSQGILLNNSLSFFLNFVPFLLTTSFISLIEMKIRSKCARVHCAVVVVFKS
jgi:hypothetical protein